MTPEPLTPEERTDLAARWRVTAGRYERDLLDVQRLLATLDALTARVEAVEAALRLEPKEEVSCSMPGCTMISHPESTKQFHARQLRAAGLDAQREGG